jgi:ferritin
MKIKDAIQEAISDQINAEFFSAYLYLAMANYFQGASLPGFAHWVKKQAAEELSHAMKFFSYVSERNGSVKLKPIAQPTLKWESPLHVFEDILSHEQSVTERINKLMDQAMAEKDHASVVELQWFVKEQVEEESSAGVILDKIRMVGTSTQGMVLIDKELSAR